MNLTKFLPPKPAHVLDRERLTSKLLAWEDKKLVIIHAQAGQGKSTLAAGHVQSLAAPSVWYTMDQEDMDLAVFLSALGTAIRRVWPESVPTVPSIPLNRYGINGVRQDIGTWIEQVFRNIPKPCLLVFDDYIGTSTSPDLQHLMKQLIDNTPPHVRFMIISRLRPELDIAKLRATQSVGELTGEDLRFTDGEVQDLFSIVFSMHISVNEAVLINSTAEGWPAGLVLMHEYLSTLAPGARALALIDKRAAGFRTNVFDYLAQEVFAHLPQAMQRFLLQTAIVDFIPVPLIELLTGLPGTAPSGKASISSMVKELRDRNLFVTARGGEWGGWGGGGEERCSVKAGEEEECRRRGKKGEETGNFSAPPPPIFSRSPVCSRASWCRQRKSRTMPWRSGRSQEASCSMRSTLSRAARST